MARRITLKPSRSKHPNTPWQVNLPGNVTSSGKRERHFFKTKADAETYCQQQRVRLENFGRNSSGLAPMDQDDAVRAIERLKPYGVTLNQAVSDYIARIEATRKSVTFKVMFEAYQAFSGAKVRKGQVISPSYARQLKDALQRFPGIQAKMLPTISSEDIERELAGVPSSSRNAVLRCVRAAFNYAITERKWATESPIRKSMFWDTGEKRIEILSNRQVCRLLLACIKTDPELLPYHLLGFFAGIRPDQELGKLRWENIQMNETVIRVPAEVAKTHYERYIDIEPTLAAWLEFAGVQKAGLITPKTNLIKRLRAIRRRAGIKDWIQDGARHTYATNWMALHKDEDRCRDNMGHRTKDELQKHYRKHIPLKEAKRFWEILPKARWTARSQVARVA